LGYFGVQSFGGSGRLKTRWRESVASSIGGSASEIFVAPPGASLPPSLLIGTCMEEGQQATVQQQINKSEG